MPSKLDFVLPDVAVVFPATVAPDPIARDVCSEDIVVPIPFLVAFISRVAVVSEFLVNIDITVLLPNCLSFPPIPFSLVQGHSSPSALLVV